MRFAGVDIASETHVVAVVSDDDAISVKPTSFTEDAEGYRKLFDVLGAPGDLLVAMEATGHYWKNLFAALAAAGYAVALINPLRTHRFAAEDLERTKTDAIDALGIARFAAQKRPASTQLPDAVTEELRELVRLRERLVQDFGDRLRQLHRVVDLGFPEFTRYVHSLDSQLASTILHDYPTAAAFHGVSVKRLATLRYVAATSRTSCSSRAWLVPTPPVGGHLVSRKGANSPMPGSSGSASPRRARSSYWPAAGPSFRTRRRRSACSAAGRGRRCARRPPRHPGARTAPHLRSSRRRSDARRPAPRRPSDCRRGIRSHSPTIALPGFLESAPAAIETWPGPRPKRK